jgi:hypothetical protein
LRNLRNKKSSPCSSPQNSDSSFARGLERGSITRGSIQQRSSSPTKRSSVRYVIVIKYCLFIFACYADYMFLDNLLT